MRLSASSLLNAIANSAVILGLVLAVLAFRSDQSNATKEFTLTFLEPYLTGNLFLDKEKLFTVMSEARAKYPDLGTENYSVLLAKRVTVDPEVRTSVVRIAEFYNSVRACVQGGVCDETLVVALTRGEPQHLLCILQPSFDLLIKRTGIVELNEGLSYFARDFECRKGQPYPKPPPSVSR